MICRDDENRDDDSDHGGVIGDAGDPYVEEEGIASSYRR